MFELHKPYVLVLVSGLCFYIVLRYVYRRTKYPTPPSPLRLPLVGNIFNLPTGTWWKMCQKLGKELDTDILSFDVLGTQVIVLNSFTSTVELLEKRSTLYSSRPRVPMIHDLMDYQYDFGLMPYGTEWRIRRRMFHSLFNTRDVRRFLPKEHKSAHDLLRLLLQDPDSFINHIRHVKGCEILDIAYGIQVKEPNNQYLQIAEEALKAFGEATVPGAYLVNSFPWMVHIPDWLPGAGFKKKAKDWGKLLESMSRLPFEKVEHELKDGTALPSYVTYALQDLQSKNLRDEEVDLQRETIRGNAAVMFSGGVQTTVTTIQTFILGMLSNPEIQEKAQAEIDSVLGLLLPTFEDEKKLPLVSAIVREAFRWEPVLPVGVPHSNISEDIYRSYRIPKDAIVVPNIWAMLHDKNVYPEPEKFNPERFIKDGKLTFAHTQDPLDIAFGFGRRVCPGRHMAYSSVWINIASILAVFRISKATDKDGTLIEPSYQYTPVIVTAPLPFKCRITPRSKDAEDLINLTSTYTY